MDSVARFTEYSQIETFVVCKELTVEPFWRCVFQLLSNNESIVGVTVSHTNFVFTLSNTETIVHKEQNNKQSVVGVKIDIDVERRLQEWNATCVQNNEPHMLLSAEDAYTSTTFDWGRFSPAELVRLIPQLFTIRINVCVLLPDLYMVCTQIKKAKQCIVETDAINVGNIVKKQYMAELIFCRATTVGLCTQLMRHAHESVSYLHLIGEITPRIISAPSLPITDRISLIIGTKNQMLAFPQLPQSLRTCIEQNPFIATLFTNLDATTCPNQITVQAQPSQAAC